jgi:hypothetical protein
VTVRKIFGEEGHDDDADTPESSPPGSGPSTFDGPAASMSGKERSGQSEDGGNGSKS